MATKSYTVAERIERLQSVSEELGQWPPTKETIVLAIGIWLDYPGLHFGSVRKEGKYATEAIRSYANATHKAATRLLMRLAKEHGLAPGPLYRASVVCRQLYAENPLRAIPGKTDCIWPDILGSRRDDLPQRQRDAIDAGEDVFQELWVALQQVWQKAETSTPTKVTNAGIWQSEGDGDKPPAPDDPLCDRAQIVLQVLWQEKAVDSDSRLSTAVIVETAGGIDPVPYKPVIADLRRRGYVNTKQGSGGGVWLTKQGKDRAAKL